MFQKSYISIQKKLLLLLFIFILIPMEVYCYLSFQNMRHSFGQKYAQQTLNALAVSADSVSAQISIADHAVRSVHFNREFINLMSQDFQTLSLSERLSISKQIFSYMTQIYSSVPEASQLRLDSFQLRHQMILTSDLQTYEKEHIYLAIERSVDSVPYETTITPTHIQYDYQVAGSNIDQYSLVFSISMPIYAPPFIENPIGKLTIDIPIDTLAQRCHSLINPEEKVLILDEYNTVVYSSSDEASAMTQEQDPYILQLLEESTGSRQAFTFSGSRNVFFYTDIQKPGSNWHLIKITPQKYIYAEANSFFLHSLLLLIICTISIMLLSFIAIIRFTKPLLGLTNYVNSIEQGNLTDHMSSFVTYTKHDEIGVLIMSIKRMMYTINHFTIQKYQLELSNRTNELKALQAQINPHFIYNVLQCLAAQALDTENLPLYRSIVTLGQMMQYSMDTDNRLVPLKQEISHCMNYINLQSLRFQNNHLQVSTTLDPMTEDFLIPKMSIQPLVENAFKHGNLLKADLGILKLSAYIQESSLHIQVFNSGKSISAEKALDINSQLSKMRSILNHSPNSEVIKYFQMNSDTIASSQDITVNAKLKDIKENIHGSDHIGLYNVYMRLLLEYQNQCYLKLSPDHTFGTNVDIEISLNTLKKKEERNS